jgi:hypothetical protein
MHTTFMIDNFLHDSRTRHEINKLRLKDLARLIKYVSLWLIYIVVNVCLNRNQTRQHEDKLLPLRNNMARPLAKVKMNNNFPFSQFLFVFILMFNSLFFIDLVNID